MASLHPPLAVAAQAYGDIETAHDRPPNDLLLILGLAAFHLHVAAAMRAALRQGNGDPFIHERGDRAARLPAIAQARFAAWPLGIGFRRAARMRRGLTLAGAQCGFQFPA